MKTWSDSSCGWMPPSMHQLVHTHGSERLGPQHNGKAGTQSHRFIPCVGTTWEKQEVEPGAPLALSLPRLSFHFLWGVDALSTAPLTRSGCRVGLFQLALCVCVCVRNRLAYSRRWKVSENSLACVGKKTKRTRLKSNHSFPVLKNNEPENSSKLQTIYFWL